MPARIWPLGRSFLQGAFSHGTAARAVLAGTAALLTLPALEIGYRLQSQRPVLALTDWREARIETVRYGERTQFDSELGWVPREELEGPGYNTLEYGIRRNLCETEVRAGGVLAVGDVFTNGGYELNDGETWPAHLERLTGVPVLNAGVVGYATDQIVLRAEQLLPVLKPHTLVVGVHEEAIVRARHAAFGRPKPYFTIDRGELVVHRLAGQQATPHGETGGGLRAALGYSAVLDAVLAHAASGYWIGKAGELQHSTVDIDPVAVTCALLQRLKARAEAQGVRVLLLMQHARKTVAESAEPATEAKQVAACASAMGLETIDQHEGLRAIATGRPGALDALYLTASPYGQMSSKGNRAAAELIAAALAKAEAARE